MKQNCRDNNIKTSYFRLIGAVSAQWESCGYAGMTARQISTAADAPVSSIYHHFESLEHLFATSQDECVSRARDWCELQLDQIASLKLGTQGFAEFFAHVVDEWTERSRPLAFAWRECELLAVRSPQFARQLAAWRSLWADFWKQAGAIFDLGNNAAIAERLFDSESLFHMIRWRRAVDRAALTEIAHGLTQWLAGKPASEAPWREHAHAEALRTSAQSIATRDGTAAVIVEAAAELIAALGVAGVTHRAVAERAGLPLGTVSHKFRTKSALLDAAFEGLYLAMIAKAAEPRQPPAAPTLDSVAGEIVQAIPHGFARAGGDDLILAAARDSSLSGFGAQLRYLRGRSSRSALQGFLGPQRDISLVEGTLYSGFLSAQLRRHSEQSENSAATIREELRALISLLGG